MCSVIYLVICSESEPVIPVSWMNNSFESVRLNELLKHVNKTGWIGSLFSLNDSLNLLSSAQLSKTLTYWMKWIFSNNTLKQNLHTHLFGYQLKNWITDNLVTLTCKRVSQTLNALRDMNRWWKGVSKTTTGLTFHQSNSKENNTRSLNWTNQRVGLRSGRSQPC